jgi:hypothetical protein
MTRHQRRKLAAARNADKLARLACAAIAERNAAIVNANLSSPVRPERSPKGMGNRSVYAGSDSHRGYVCKAGGAMPRNRAMALKAKGSY